MKPDISLSDQIQIIPVATIRPDIGYNRISGTSLTQACLFRSLTTTNRRHWSERSAASFKVTRFRPCCSTYVSTPSWRQYLISNTNSVDICGAQLKKKPTGGRGCNSRMTPRSSLMTLKVNSLCWRFSVAWCVWAEMMLRIDKWSAFGLAKRSGQYVQIKPGIFVGGVQIPPIKTGKSLKYFDWIFDFNMGNAELEKKLEVKVNSLLSVTSALKVRPQSKLKIVRKYFPTQLSFQLKVSDISFTWISRLISLTDW